MNQQGDNFLFEDFDAPAGFQSSTKPHGYGFQFFAGRRNKPAELNDGDHAAVPSGNTLGLRLQRQQPYDQRDDACVRRGQRRDDV
jgi:hypothetical protein